MRAWVDIINPSQALFFSSLLRSLPSMGYFLTIRERAETVELTRMLGMPGRVVGAYHDGASRKTLDMIKRTVILLYSVAPFDLSLSFENGMSVLVSRVRRRRSILLCDNDLKFTQKGSVVQSIETRVKGMADDVVVPRACLGPFRELMGGAKVHAYDGFKEDVYLSDYAPDPEFSKAIPFDEYVVVRPEALGSHYVKERRSIVPEMVRRFNKEDVNVVFLPREGTDLDHVKGLDVFVPGTALNGLDLCNFSRAVLTGSGTMAREAACMGQTAVSFFPGSRLLSVDRQLVEEGKVLHSRDPAEIVDHVLRSKKGPALELDRCRKVREEVVRIISTICAG